MQFFEKTEQTTPWNVKLGVRCFLVCSFIGYLFSDQLFIACTPDAVFSNYYAITLFTSTYAYNSIFSLVGCVFIGWRRLVQLETENGTFGFLLWILWVSLTVHTIYVVLAFFVIAKWDPTIVSQPVHGVWPLLCATFVYDAKSDPLGEVKLWPLQFSLYNRVMPVLCVLLSWCTHMNYHLDVIVALIFSLVAPASPWFTIPDVSLHLLDTYDFWLLNRIRDLQCFQMRQQGFRALPTYTGSGARCPKAFNGVFTVDDAADAEFPNLDANEFSFDYSADARITGIKGEAAVAAVGSGVGVLSYTFGADSTPIPCLSAPPGSGLAAVNPNGHDSASMTGVSDQQSPRSQQQQEMGAGVGAPLGVVGQDGTMTLSSTAGLGLNHPGADNKTTAAAAGTVVLTDRLGDSDEAKRYDFLTPQRVHEFDLAAKNDDIFGDLGNEDPFGPL